MTRTCPNCGVEFFTRNPQKLYCKRTCAKSWWEKKTRRDERLATEIARQQAITEMLPTTPDLHVESLQALPKPKDDFQWPAL